MLVREPHHSLKRSCRRPRRPTSTWGRPHLKQQRQDWSCRRSFYPSTRTCGLRNRLELYARAASFLPVKCLLYDDPLLDPRAASGPSCGRCSRSRDSLPLPASLSFVPTPWRLLWKGWWQPRADGSGALLGSLRRLRRGEFVRKAVREAWEAKLALRSKACGARNRNVCLAIAGRKAVPRTPQQRPQACGNVAQEHRVRLEPEPTCRDRSR